MMDDTRHLTWTVISQILLAWILLGIVILLESLPPPYPSAAGWVAVTGAIVSFGATGIPMKYKNMKDANVDPSVFSLYTALGLFIVNFPFCIYLLSIHSFEFELYSLLGATFIAIIGYLSYIAVQILGYAKAPAIWASIGMICSYIWGVTYFHERSTNMILSSCSIIFLVIGVYCVATSQGGNSSEPSPKTTESPTYTVLEDNKDITHISINTSSPTTTLVNIEENKLESTDMYLDINPVIHESIQKDCINNSNYNSNNNNDNNDNDKSNDNNTIMKSTSDDNNKIISECIISDYQTDTTNINKKTHFLNYLKLPPYIITSLLLSSGYIFCLLTGIVDGSLMVPFKLSYATNVIGTLQYIGSFGISSIIMTPIIFLLYTYGIRTTTLRYEELRIGFFPGFSSGILWATANVMSVKATYYLGMKVGFPLTQTCIVITAFWGIIYFKEFDLFHSGYGIRFSIGFIAILIGAYLLGSTSSSSSSSSSSHR